MSPPRLGEVTWTDGFWADRVQLVESAMIPSLREALNDPDNAAYLGNFAAASAPEPNERRHVGVDWGDGDCYKYLEVLTLVSARDGSSDLSAEIEHLIGLIAAAQDGDGYISTNIQLDPQKSRWSKPLHHELYNMGHLMTAAATHATVTGRQDFLRVAIKAAGYLYSTFVPMTPELSHFGWNLSTIMGLVDLYRVTGEPRHLELARVLVDMPGSHPGGSDETQDAVRLREETLAVGHAVTGPYLCAGALDVAAETGDRELVDAAARIWENATQRRMYVTGGIGSHHYSSTPREHRVWEAFGLDYDLPNATAYNETCANLALGMWSARLATMTADARYSDVVERVMYNAGASGVSLDGRTFCYTNPLRWHGTEHELLSNDTPGRWDRHSCYCCPVQVARVTARIHEWFYGISADAVWVHQYGGSRLAAVLEQGPIALEQRTDFPWSGTVRIEVTDAPDGDAAIHLRIPAWASDAVVSVNGVDVGEQPSRGSYVTIRRHWRPGDQIDLEIPMQPVQISAHAKVESARNQVAIARGPVVYCLESHDVPEDVPLAEVHVPHETSLSVRRDPSRFGGEVPVLTGTLLRLPRAEPDDLYFPAPRIPPGPFEGSLVPYFAWGNRGIAEMAVWLPTR
jgi:DUF1680 family protein